MKRIFTLLLAAFLISVSLSGFAKEDASKGKGEALFKANCSPCHPEGGNIVNPAFTLKKKDREAHGVKTAKDIIGKMRNPGPGMTKFDTATIPDKGAKEIAEYILKTFN